MLVPLLLASFLTGQSVLAEAPGSLAYREVPSSLRNLSDEARSIRKFLDLYSLVQTKGKTSIGDFRVATDTPARQLGPGNSYIFNYSLPSKSFELLITVRHDRTKVTGIEGQNIYSFPPRWQSSLMGFSNERPLIGPWGQYNVDQNLEFSANKLSATAFNQQVAKGNFFLGGFQRNTFPGFGARNRGQTISVFEGVAAAFSADASLSSREYAQALQAWDRAEFYVPSHWTKYVDLRELHAARPDTQGWRTVTSKLMVEGRAVNPIGTAGSIVFAHLSAPPIQGLEGYSLLLVLYGGVTSDSGGVKARNSLFWVSPTYDQRSDTSKIALLYPPLKHHLLNWTRSPYDDWQIVDFFVIPRKRLPLSTSAERGFSRFTFGSELNLEKLPR